jgi:2-polyprenyl-6-methoxyphenol hydroxylase-like FAD-dependent oxidoreductase
VQILDQLGMLPAVQRAGAIPIDRFTPINDDVRIDGNLDPPRTAGLCPRRLVLDPLLQGAASSAGAELRTGCRVTGVIRDDGRVAGVDTAQGPIRAALTVGADGRNSVIADAVGAAEYLTTPPGRIPAWGYFRGVTAPEGRLRIGRVGDVAFLASPTDSDLYMAGIAVDVSQQQTLHRDREGTFRQGVNRWPELADLLSGTQREGPIRVMTKWHGYFRQSAGPGWVLVGDAGHFKDFTPAQGISDAFRHANRLAADVIGGFQRSNLDAATGQWWKWRDRDAYEMYWLAADMGAPGEATPLVTRLLRDISTDPAAIDKLLRVLNHELLPSRLFTPTRVITAAVRSLRDRPDRIWPTLRDIGSALRAEAYRRFSGAGRCGPPNPRRVLGRFQALSRGPAARTATPSP